MACITIVGDVLAGKYLAQWLARGNQDGSIPGVPHLETVAERARYSAGDVFQTCFDEHLLREREENKKVSEVLKRHEKALQSVDIGSSPTTSSSALSAVAAELPDELLQRSASPLAFFVQDRAAAELADNEPTPCTWLANLETSLVRDEEFEHAAPAFPLKRWSFKSPSDAAATTLKSLGISVVAMGNNHSVDYSGTPDALLAGVSSLDAQAIKHTGAGRGRADAFKPAVILREEGSAFFQHCGVVAVVSLALPDCHLSGTFDHKGRDMFCATDSTPRLGVAMIDPERDLVELYAQLRSLRNRVHQLVVMMHWGPNYPPPRENPPWPYLFNEAHRRIARELIDEAGVTLIVGTSAHCVHGIELHNGVPILYSTGDALADYELDPEFYDVPLAFRDPKKHPAGVADAAFLSFVYQVQFENRQVTELRLTPIQHKNLRALRMNPEEENTQKHVNAMRELCAAYGTNSEILRGDGNSLRLVIKVDPRPADTRQAGGEK